MTIEAYDTLSNQIYAHTVTQQEAGNWKLIELADADGVLIAEINGDFAEVYIDEVCFQ
jgi:hypothetical protein